MTSSKADTVELKSCPFCGGVPYVSMESVGDDSLDEVWRIYCAGCPAMMESAGTSDDELNAIVDAWNREKVQPARKG